MGQFVNTMAVGVVAGRPGWAAVNGFGSCDRLVGMLLEASIPCGLPRTVYRLFPGLVYSPRHDDVKRCFICLYKNRCSGSYNAYVETPKVPDMPSNIRVSSIRKAFGLATIEGHFHIRHEFLGAKSKLERHPARLIVGYH